MIKAEIKNIKMFEEFLNIVNKFVPQCMIEIGLDNTTVYCKNSRDYPSARLLLDTNLIQLKEKQNVESVKVCIRDVVAFRTAIGIISQVDDKIETITINLDGDFDTETGDYIVRAMKYSGASKFNLATVDFQIVEQYVSKNITNELKSIWDFYINPRKLDIVQNRTSNIVNMEEVSIYLYSENGKVIADLASRQSPTTNSISIPISDTYNGELKDSGFEEVCVHDSAFRLFNILRVNGLDELNCLFDSTYNVFYLTSQLENMGYYVKSRLLVKIIQGK